MHFPLTQVKFSTDNIDIYITEKGMEDEEGEGRGEKGKGKEKG